LSGAVSVSDGLFSWGLLLGGLQKKLFDLTEMATYYARRVEPFFPEPHADI
jgi:hypothetical protein